MDNPHFYFFYWSGLPPFLFLLLVWTTPIFISIMAWITPILFLSLVWTTPNFISFMAWITPILFLSLVWITPIYISFIGADYPHSYLFYRCGLPSDLIHFFISTFIVNIVILYSQKLYIYLFILKLYDQKS